MLSPNGILTGDQIGDAFIRDWARDRIGRTLAVVRPASAQEVSQVCRLCADAGVGIVPQGGHTGLVGGAQRPEENCIILSTQRMNGILDLDCDNLSCTVEAGVVLETLQATLKEQGQQFGVAIGSQGSAQIGGLISTNAGGMQVLRHGMMAAHVMGLELVLADGSIVSSISGLHKDNRGPDPLRLAIGGEGAFGIITKACLRISPQWQCAATAYVGCASFVDALALLRHLRGAAHEVLSAFEVMSAACLPLAKRVDPTLVPPLEAPVHVLVQLGSVLDLPLDSMLEDALAAAIEQGIAADAVVAKSDRQVQRLWALREGLVEGHSRRGYHVRSDVSLRLGQLPDAVSALEAMLEAEFPGWIAQSYGHMGDGNLHFNALPPETIAETEAREIGRQIEQRIFYMVLDLDGSFSAEHGIGRTKAGWFHETMPARHDLLARIKAALDPDTMMNPGCLLVQEDGPR
ncbi:MAG: FAD-binding oxidoreductase [Sphingomonadales bacterium]|nr:FAD-binding oxidoreductase [Sphingomonadales bacterium]